MINDCRYVYFLIWGHGYRYNKEILDILRQEPSFTILRIQDYTAKSIRKFVHGVYSHDYAPFHHLRLKTSYLLRTPNEVRIVFLINTDVHERFFGSGDYHHIECEHVKNIKENIRNLFNPRHQGVRTEDHVIHASDNEQQVENLMRIIGIKDGLDYFKRNSEMPIHVPYYLEPPKAISLKAIKVQKIFCRIVEGTKTQFYTRICPLQDSPHYRFLTEGCGSYGRYIETFLGGPLTVDYSEARFRKIASSLKYLEEPFLDHYILLQKTDSTSRYVVVDGLHRICVLKRNGLESITAAVLS